MYVCRNQDILANPVYIGTIASQKSDYKFKVGWLGYKDPEDWIVVENMHEPIVDREVFELVHEKVKSRKRPDAWGNYSIFAGLVKCGQCGSTLNIRRANQKGKDKIYTCSRYIKYGVKHCSQHKIQFDVLYDIVLTQIRRYAQAALSDEESVAEELRMHTETGNQTEWEIVQKSIAADTERIRELDALTLNRLIQAIVVQEDFTEDGIHQTVEIHWNFKGNAEKLRLERE